MTKTSSKPLLVIAFLASFYLLPLWGARYTIMQDVPAHVEIGCQLLHIWRGDPVFTSALFVHGQPWANSLPSVLLAGLLAVVPSFAAVKIALSFYVIAWPLSVALLLRSFGRSPWLALLCLPTTLDFTWAFGFYNFLLAKPLFCLALVYARGVAMDGGAKRGLVLAAILTLLFTSHSLIWILAMGSASLILLLRAESIRTSIARSWPLALSVGASVPFFYHTFSSPSPGATTFRTPLRSLESTWEDLGSLNKSHGDEIAWILALVLLVVVVVTAGRRPLREKGRDRTVLGLLGVFLYIAYIFGPVTLPQVEIVAQRLPVFAAVLLCACAPAPRRALVPVLTFGMAVAAFIHAGDLTRNYRAFSAIEMGNFEELIKLAPPRGRMGTDFQWTTSPYGRENAAWHWPKLYCLYGGGITDDTFAYRHTAFVEVRPEARARGFVTPPNRLRPAALAKYSSFLYRGTAAGERPAKGSLELIGTTGTWRLSKIRKP